MKLILLFLLISILSTSCSQSVGSSKNTTSGIKPKAYSESHHLQLNQEYRFFVPLAHDEDSLKQELIYKLIDSPKSGIVSDTCLLATKNNSNRSCTYKPDSSFIGVDSLSYKVIDPSGNESEIQKITFNIGGNEKPDKNLNVAGIDFIFLIDDISMKQRQNDLNSAILTFTQDLKKYVPKTPFRFGFLNQFESNKKRFLNLSRNPAGKKLALTSQMTNTDFNKFMLNLNSILKSQESNNINQPFKLMNEILTAEHSWFKPNNMLVYIILSHSDETSYPNQSLPSDKTYLSPKHWLSQVEKSRAHPNHVKVFPIVDYKVTKEKTAHDRYNRFHEIAKLSDCEIFDINKKFDQSFKKISRHIASYFKGKTNER